MEYIIEKYENEENSIEWRAARLAQLPLMDVKNGGLTFIYNDLGLNSLQRQYKKFINQIIENHITDGIYSIYRYTPEYIETVKKYVLTIKSNPRKA